MIYFFLILFVYFLFNNIKNFFIFQFLFLYLLLLILIILFFVIIVYIMFYNFYISRKYLFSYKIWLKIIFCIKLNKESVLSFLKYKNYVFNFCFHKTNIPPVFFKKIFFFKNNKKLISSLIKDINCSTKSIYIIFYILESCAFLDKVLLSLVKASHRGVVCKIILDSIGSIKFFKTIWPKIMIDAGIELVESFKFSFLNFIFNRLDLRQHKKFILIDSNITYIGSMNLIDSNNFKKYLNLGKWIDLMIKIKGSFLLQIMKLIFSYDWELETGVCILNKNFFLNFKNIYMNKKKKISKIIQVVNYSFGLPKDLIHKSLLNIIFSAKKRLVITTPYFVPTKYLLDAIFMIAKKGINVKIIIPNKNDSFLLYLVNNVFLKYLLLKNIQVYIFKNGFLHTKTILIDHNISIIGSINFDIRSILLNFEIALIIDNISINKRLYNINKKYISQSKLINKNNFKNKFVIKNILSNFFYIFNSLL